MYSVGNNICLQIKDMDQKIGDGVVLKDSGGGAFRKDLLAVSKGEIVTILKMTDTPAGKWLVQNANGKSEACNTCTIVHFFVTCILSVVYPLKLELNTNISMQLKCSYEDVCIQECKLCKRS